MNFHNVSLPKCAAIFAVGCSEFFTSTAISMSGREMRNSDTQKPKRRYSLQNCCLSLQQFEAFYSFFQARAGQRFSFRLRDHFDYKVERQIIGVGDGVNTEFQLCKTYDDELLAYVRTITKPVRGSVSLWHIDQELEVESMDENSGKVSLSEPPGEGVEVSASFVFDVPVRFAADAIRYSLGADGSIIVEDVELIEVYE